MEPSDILDEKHILPVDDTKKVFDIPPDHPRAVAW